jgi:signal transduction histidine kinase
MPPVPQDELIARLTGVRSAKPTYYRQYRRTAEGLDRSVRALEEAAGALLDVVAGPVRLVEDFACAAVRVFDSPWAAVVAEHPAFGSGAVTAAAGPDGLLPAGAAPGGLAGLLAGAGPGAVPPGGAPAGRVLSAPLGWVEGRGWLAVGLEAGQRADPTDEALLATLAHQLVAAVRGAHLVAEAERMRAESTAVREELAHMRAQEQLDRQREHLARDLHDTVVQQVLGIGYKLEWCRGRVADPEVGSSLLEARELARATVEHIRSAIAELTEPSPGADGALVARIQAVVAELDGRGATVRLDPPPDLPGLPASTERAVEMIVREAVANAVVHACAARVGVSLAVQGDEVVVEVGDDGVGEPERLRDHLAEALQHRGMPYGRGLANSFLRAREAGGSFQITGAPGGGVLIRAVVPAGTPGTPGTT